MAKSGGGLQGLGGMLVQVADGNLPTANFGTLVSTFASLFSRNGGKGSLGGGGADLRSLAAASALQSPNPSAKDMTDAKRLAEALQNASRPPRDAVLHKMFNTTFRQPEMARAFYDRLAMAENPAFALQRAMYALHHAENEALRVGKEAPSYLSGPQRRGEMTIARLKAFEKAYDDLGLEAVGEPIPGGASPHQLAVRADQMRRKNLGGEPLPAQYRVGALRDNKTLEGLIAERWSACNGDREAFLRQAIVDFTPDIAGGLQGDSTLLFDNPERRAAKANLKDLSGPAALELARRDIEAQNAYDLTQAAAKDVHDQLVAAELTRAVNDLEPEPAVEKAPIAERQPPTADSRAAFEASLRMDDLEIRSTLMPSGAPTETNPRALKRLEDDPSLGFGHEIDDTSER